MEEAGGVTSPGWGTLAWKCSAPGTILLRLQWATGRAAQMWSASVSSEAPEVANIALATLISSHQSSSEETSSHT